MIRGPIWVARIPPSCLFVCIVVYFEDYNPSNWKVRVPQQGLLVLDIKVLASWEILSYHIDLARNLTRCTQRGKTFRRV